MGVLLVDMQPCKHNLTQVTQASRDINSRSRRGQELLPMRHEDAMYDAIDERSAISDDTSGGRDKYDATKAAKVGYCLQCSK